MVFEVYCALRHIVFGGLTLDLYGIAGIVLATSQLEGDCWSCISADQAGYGNGTLESRNRSSADRR